MKKRILVVKPNFYPESFVINDFVFALNDMGYECHVVTQCPSYALGKVFAGYKNVLLQNEIWNGIHIYRVKTLSNNGHSIFKKGLQYLCFSFLSSIVCLTRFLRFDKVFVYQVGSITVCIPAVLMKFIHRTNVYIWIQDIWPHTLYDAGFSFNYLLRKIINSICQFIYNSFDIIFISSPGFRNLLLTTTQVVYAPNWALERTKPKARDRGKILTFLFSGNLGKYQDLSNTIKAFRQANLLCSGSLNLKIYGSGMLKNRLKELTIYDNWIVWNDWVSSEKLGHVIDDIDILLLPLTSPGPVGLTIPGKFQFYLYSARPIFSIARSGVSSIVSEYNLGLVADPDNVDEISNRLIDFYNMTDSQLKSMANNAAGLSSEYNKISLIHQMEELIRL